MGINSILIYLEQMFRTNVLTRPVDATRKIYRLFIQSIRELLIEACRSSHHYPTDTHIYSIAIY